MNQNLQTEADLTAIAIRPMVADVVATAKSVIVSDPASRQIAVDGGKDMLRREKLVREKMDPLCDSAQAVADGLKKMRDGLLGGPKEAKGIYANKISVYDVEEKRKARIVEEARLAEVRRYEEERKKAEDSARAAALKSEEDARIAHAAEAERLGNSAAPLIVETPTAVAPLHPVAPAPVAYVAPVEAPEQSGSIGKEQWVYHVDDLMALMRAVVEGKAPVGLIVSEKKQADFRSAGLRTYITRTATEYPLPGVRAWKEYRTSFVDDAGEEE